MTGVTTALVARALQRRELSEKAWETGGRVLGWSGETTASGRSVGVTESLQLIAVYACGRVLTNGVIMAPLHVYRHLDGGGNARDPQHRLHLILHETPNTEMTRPELWSTVEGHLAYRGNAYLNIERTGRGVVGLWPLRPDRMTVRRNPNTRQLEYLYTLPSGERRTLPRDEVCHIRGLGSDGVLGYSPVTLAREAIGLGLAQEEWAARFYDNNAAPSGVLEYAGELSPDARENLRDSFETAHRHLNRSHRIAVLEEGVTYKQVGLAPIDAQFLESRKFQVTEIARLFGVPPHLIGDVERSTSWGTGIEQQNLGFLTFTLAPWLVLIEAAIKRDLLPETTHFARFNVDAFLRADLKTRYEAYQIGRQTGFLSDDDIRESEDRVPLPDGQGAGYIVPLNMGPAEALRTTAAGLTFAQAVRAASDLIKAGFDPAAALAAVGLPSIAHTGRETTVATPPAA